MTGKLKQRQNRDFLRTHCELELSVVFLSAVLTAVSGCGVPSENPLVGTWTLTRVTCNGTFTAIPSGVGMTLAFTSSKRVLARTTTSTCSSREESASLSFDGVDLTEGAPSRLCTAGCTILAIQLPGEGASTCGLTATPLDSRTYRYRLATEGRMERKVLGSNHFCEATDASGNPITETQLFTLSGS
jgi:hypothetical protein